MRQKGFTIIELLVVLSIFTFALGAIGGFLIYSYRARDYTLSKSLTVASAQKAVGQITKEIREATQSNAGSYLLKKCDDFEITFYSDNNKDDLVERIRYFLEDEKLKKGEISPSGEPLGYGGEENIKIVASYIKNTSTPLFYCYDKNYAGKSTDLPLSTPVASEQLDEVSLIGIKMQIEVDIGARENRHSLEIESKAQLRNTKQNYE